MRKLFGTFIVNSSISVLRKHLFVHSYAPKFHIMLNLQYPKIRCMFVYTTLLSVIDLRNKTLKLRYWKLQITLCAHSSAIQVRSVNKLWIQKHLPRAVHFITFVSEEERASQFGIFRSNRKKYVRLTVRHIDNFFPETIHFQIWNPKILIDIKNYVQTQQRKFYVP